LGICNQRSASVGGGPGASADEVDNDTIPSVVAPSPTAQGGGAADGGGAAPDRPGADAAARAMRAALARFHRALSLPRCAHCIVLATPGSTGRLRNKMVVKR